MNTAPTDSQPVDLGIVVALAEEFRELLDLAGARTSEKDANLIAYRFSRGPYSILATLAGDKGEVAATQVTERLIRGFNPASILSVGIAAGVHDDLRVGDVHVPLQAVEYLQDAKASPKSAMKEAKRTAKRTAPAVDDFALTPGALAARADFTFIEAVQNLEFMHPEVHSGFRAACAADLRTLVQDDKARERLFHKNLVRREVALLADGHVATGPVVNVADAFTAWIRSHHRNVKSLEMESAAVLRAAQNRREPKRALAIRGISDYGDPRKRALDGIGGGSLRKYAMRNAVRLLFALLDTEALPRNPP